ncbi:MAG: hypothetical protein JKY61_05355 [Planctomycetes bacterium]|nr:hypothetical protein [Planctomycetota bacterium]
MSFAVNTRTASVFRNAGVALLLLLVLGDVARAETAGRIISIAQRIASGRIRAAAEEALADTLRIKSNEELQKFFEEDYRLTSERDSKLAELLAEKELTRKELAAGMFCSVCKRSKSKIERQTKAPFPEHLTEVNGKAIPMTPDQIQKQMEAYDKEMAALEVRYNKQIKTLRERHDRRSSALIEQIVNIEVRAYMRRIREGSKLRGRLAQAIAAYKARNSEGDSFWHQSWLERMLAQRTQSQLDRMRSEPPIKRAELAMSLLIARGDLEMADKVEERLQELRESRRTTQARNAERSAETLDNYGRVLFNRQQARGEEEQRIVLALSKAGMGGYSPMGLQLHGNWGAVPDPRLAVTRMRTAEAIRNIREQYADAVEESQTEISGLSALQDGAMRLAESLGGWFQKRPEVARANVERLMDFLAPFKQLTPKDISPTVLDNVIMQVGTKGWPTVTPKNLRFGIGFDLAILSVRRWNVREMREALRQSRGGSLSEYEIDSILREIDPDVGIHKWFLPHDPGLTKYLEGVYSYIEDMKEQFFGTRGY